MNEPQVILELRGVKKSFGEHLVHREINLQIRKGETIGLLGGSGTGKSVLLRSIIGLEFVDEGQIIFEGKPVQDMTELQFMELRSEISYSFQSGALFDSENVFDNIAFPLIEHSKLAYPEIEKRVNAVLKLIDLESKGHLMPAELSGGMQKRVGMARAMIRNPKIMLYDEPTAGLDPNNTLNILNIMTKFKEQGVTSIFVTHDIPAALKVCDRIVILNQGKIEFNGTTEEARNSKSPLVQKFILV